MFDVFGIGNSIVDVLVRVEDSVLEELGLSKGIMQLVDQSMSKRLYNRFKNTTIMPGGSCCNTMIGISNLGGKSAYSGAVGNDSMGQIFDEKLSEFGVAPYLTKVKGATGSSFILVTPDSERTMNTHLGVCSMIEHNSLKNIAESRIFHTTAYALDTTPEIVMKALETAKKNKITVSFDISDPFLVKAKKRLIRQVCKDYVDILFVNKEEARLFTGKKPRPAINECRKLCSTVALKLGSKGSLVAKDKIYRIPAFRVNAIDSTGAGDMYAAGLLYGLTQGYNIGEAGKIASYSASKVVEVMGARLSGKLDIQELKKSPCVFSNGNS